MALLLAGLASAQTPVLTYHNDNARTGRYLSEIVLKPGNVKAGTFGKRYLRLVDGTIYGQPLYLPRVKIAGKGLHNVIFVATGHNSLYAFDADDNSGANAAPLWQVSFNDPAHGVTAVPATDIGCFVVQPELGVIGTPVIDPVAGTIYLIAETKEHGNQYFFRLHALDVTSGAERPGSPVTIQPPGFVAFVHKQRGALLLSHGVLYSPWSSNCDQGAYHGWIMAHDPASLKLLGVFNATPGGQAGSFWNGGAGPAADAAGNIYDVSANGDFDADSGGSRYGDSVLKLATAPGLSATDFFAPFNRVFLNVNDYDVGSCGALLLPDEAGSPEHPHLLFTAGKEGRIYLLDRDHLGGAQSGSDTSALTSLPLFPHPVFGAAAYFNGSVYVGPERAPLSAFAVAHGTLATPPAQAAKPLGYLGATPSISADGDQDGIVWVISSENFGRLQAYDAAGLTQLYDSQAQPADIFGGYAEFTAPTIAGGRVYIGGSLELEVYGGLVSDPPVVTAVTNAASFRSDAVAPGSLIALFGSRLAPITAGPAPVPLPLALADVSVTVNGLAAPLLYVSPNLIDAQVPAGIAPGQAAVVVRAGGVASQPVSIAIRRAGPGIFTDPRGQAIALNANSSVNSPLDPAAAGSTVSLFVTGMGPVDLAIDDGAAPPDGTSARATLPVSVTINTVPATVIFAGLAPYAAGLARIDLKVPALASGTYPVTVTIGGAASNTARITISNR